MQENGLPLFNGILPILTLVALELLLSGMMMKWPAVARLVGGTPLPIIKDGNIDKTVMRRLRLTVDDLAESLRQQDIFDIQQVQYAIVETNGHISAYLYPQYQNATAADVGASPPDEGMPIVVVSDGKVSDWGLSLCELDDKWVETLLKKRHLRTEDVFLLTATKSGDHYMITKQEAGGKTT